MSRTSSYCAEIDALQYYSIHSKSPAPRRKQSMPSIFKRPLTPKTFEHLKSNYFFKTSGGRFKDVRQDGRCLRCFSKTHRAAACPTYTKPTPSPCKFCWHLFHQSDNCIFYDKEGKSRPSSASRTCLSSPTSDKLETYSQKVPSFDFLTEQWENKHDFYYLNQSDYEYPEHPETPEISDISTYVVSQATKAKFRFPSKDPDENNVVDNRNDAEKVKNILRI